jgi:hypothetical protein
MTEVHPAKASKMKGSSCSSHNKNERGPSWRCLKTKRTILQWPYERGSSCSSLKNERRSSCSSHNKNERRVILHQLKKRRRVLLQQPLKSKKGHPAAVSRMKDGHPAAALKTNEVPHAVAFTFKKRSSCSSLKNEKMVLQQLQKEWKRAIPEAASRLREPSCNGLIKEFHPAAASRMKGWSRSGLKTDQRVILQQPQQEWKRVILTLSQD